MRWSQTLKGTIGAALLRGEPAGVGPGAAEAQQLRSFLVNDVRDAEEKARLLAEAEAAVARVKRGCDLLVGVHLIEGLSDAERETWRAELLIEHTAKETLTSDKAQRALAAARKHNAFHWFLEFPEVFERGALCSGESGFHAFVGNPPFIGGRRIRETLGDDYREALYRLYPGSSGNADYCAFFFLRAFAHLRRGGTLGLIATNTIAQGDTRRLASTRSWQRAGQFTMPRTTSLGPVMQRSCGRSFTLSKGRCDRLSCWTASKPPHFKLARQSEVLRQTTYASQQQRQKLTRLICRWHGFCAVPRKPGLIRRTPEIEMYSFRI